MDYPKPGTFASDQPRDHEHGKRRSRAKHFHAGYDDGLNGVEWEYDIVASAPMTAGHRLGLQRYRRVQEMP